jgi:hypothetical protein
MPFDAADAELDGISLLLPIRTSGWSIAAGYLGLLSLFPFFAPVALIVSLVALRDVRARPHLRGKGRAIFGLVMGVLFTLLLALILVSAFVGP